MMKLRSVFYIWGLCILFVLNAVADDGDANSWPTWRGRQLSGVAANANPPTEWSEEKNIKWKLKIPGKGHSTPVIWENRIFVLSAVPTEKKVDLPPEQQDSRRGRRRGPRGIRSDRIHRFIIIAVDRQTGKPQWGKTLREELPHEKTHTDGSWASNSPVTDGEHVYAFFGSRGLHCLDLKGNVVWSKDLGKMKVKMQFGEGSSPALYGDTIVVNWDHEGQSFITALNKKTGDEVWKVKRDERSSWSTPLIMPVNGKPQVIVSATTAIRAYDLANGNVLWHCRGMTGNVVPVPVYSNGLLYFTSGFRGTACVAVRVAKAKGDISGTDAVAWRYNRNTPYVPSPVVVDGKLYMLTRNNAILTCLDAATGKEVYAKQLIQGVGTVYASITAAGGRLYIVGHKGTGVVVKQGPKPEVIARSRLDDSFTASPVIIGKELFLRGQNLYCISAE